MEPIPHSRPWITEADIEAVSSVLATSMLGQGERVRLIERRLAAWLNAYDGVAVGSGSAGIVLALRGLEVEAGDDVVVPTYVCRSVLEAILTVGAHPVLCDVGPDWVVIPKDVERVVSSRTRAVIVPHMYGIFADVNEFRTLGIPIIEDCAQALDAAGRRSMQGDVAVLSFHPTKCLTAGEGGMAIAASEEIVARMRSYRDGRKPPYAGRLFSPMSDIAAGLVSSQLDRYELGLARRRELAAKYRSVVESCCPSALNRAALERSMYFRFPLRLAGGLEAHQKVFAELGVHVRKGVDSLLHRDMKIPDDAYPVAAAHFETTVSLPIYPALTRAQEARCMDAVSRVLSRL